MNYQPPKFLKILYLCFVGLALVIALSIYGLFFNSMTEDDMVSSSFLWIPFLVFGITGYLFYAGKKKLSWLWALLISIGFEVLLFTFFAVLWQYL